MEVNFWNESYAPEYYGRIDSFHGFLYGANNGTMDVEGFIRSRYGTELGRRLQLRFEIEDEPMGAPALGYYNALGMRKEYFEGEDYFTRWALYTPEEMYLPEGKGKRYPLLFWNHGGGNHIESFEVVAGVVEVAAREKLMVCMPQNTNWKNAERIMELLMEKYPVDLGRVYTLGFSQGGCQTHSAFMHMPERFAGAAAAGCDLFRPYDNHDIRYTDHELTRVRSAVVPLFQMAGTCEPSTFVPLNRWTPRQTPLADVKKGLPDTKQVLALNTDPERDPTRIQNSEGFVDPYFYADGKRPSWRMNTPY